ncbi:MAG: YciI family protein [Pseudomonadota bacterium]
MALFLITCRDKPGALDVRLANRAAHLEWATAYKDSIAMIGPLFADDGETFTGSAIVKEAASKADVEAWCRDDPYAKAELFESVEIRPFRWVMGEGPPA